jgi:hypothetical protein
VPILSGECIAISALLNNHDVLAGRSFGLSPEHFIGYKAEYNWLLNYYETYGTDPSKDAFQQAFPNFTFSDHEDVRSACDMVFKAHGKRQITSAMSEAVDLLGLGDVTAAYDTLVSAQPIRTSPKPRRLLTDLDFLDNWDEPQSIIDTPYRTLNRLTGGLRAGQLWYLAARPKNGKSAHLVNMVKRSVLDGCRVKFFSLEMSEPEVRARFHAALATHYGYKGITLTAIRDRTVDRHDYKTFVGELQERLEETGGGLDIHTPKQGLVTPGVIAASADEYHLNVVDYIGLMRGEGNGRAVDDWRNLAGISNDLKLIAGSHQTALLVASQINRQGESGDGPPSLDKLAGSDALGQDGDVVLTMRAMPHNVATCFSVEGNRHGPSGKFYTEFDPNIGAFNEISAEQAEDMLCMAEEL